MTTRRKKLTAMRSLLVLAVVAAIVLASCSTQPPAPVAPTDSDPEVANLLAEVQRSPESAKAWTALGNRYFDTNRYAEAVDAYTRSLEIDPANANVWSDRGVMQRRLELYDRAVEDFKAAVSVDPTHTTSWYNMGIVFYYDVQDINAARTAFERVLELDPEFKTPSGEYLKDTLAAMQ